MHRDRDSIFGGYFNARIRGMGIEQVVNAPRAPWQNPFVERVIGSIRRECTDHLIITSEPHLRKILRLYVECYNADRIHDSLGKNAPETRAPHSREGGTVIALPRVGGVHHRYQNRLHEVLTTRVD